MALEDDLKARTSALISQQMANWVVEIQRAIQAHQAALVGALDELGETVARYDEKVDEGSIAQAIGEVISQQPPAAGGADYSSLKTAIAAIEKGANLSEVLTQLMGEVTKHVERAAMFIVKNNAAVGWHARGFDHSEAVKGVTIPLTADTVFRLAHGSRSATRGHASHSPATAQALARLGAAPQGILAVPLILRDKVAAILYCDSTHDELPASTVGFRTHGYGAPAAASSGSSAASKRVNRGDRTPARANAWRIRCLLRVAVTASTELDRSPSRSAMAAPTTVVRSSTGTTASIGCSLARGLSSVMPVPSGRTGSLLEWA